MTRDDPPRKSIMWKFWIIIVIWIVLIGVSFQGRDLLTSGIESSQEFAQQNTEAALGSDLYQERFNITSQQVSHIIVVNIPNDKISSLGNVQSNLWRNYTLYLSLYLNASLFQEGYDTIVSEPLLLQAYQAFPDPDLLEIANSLVADDKTSSLINIMSSTLDFEQDTAIVEDHVHLIRDLLADYDGFIAFVSNLEQNMDLPSGALVSSLPTNTQVDEVHVLLTGSPANFVDLIDVAKETFDQSEVISVILVTIVLALVFRSPVGVFVPILAMVSALFPSYLLTFILAETGVFGVNDFLPAIIAMIGIAVAVDYNLFSLVRFREEYRKRQADLEKRGLWNKKTARDARIESADIMNKTAGTAVMYSGTTVMIGFISLLVLGDEFTLGMAIGVSIVVFLSILTARTLTPAFLSVFGGVLDWPSFVSGARRDIESRKNGKSEKDKFWVRWSKLVMRRPVVFLILGILIISPFIILATQIDLSFSTVKSLPQGTESRQGFEVIQEDFNLGALNPYRVIIDGGNQNNSVLNSDVINATNAFALDVLDFQKTRDKDGTLLDFETVTSLSITTNDTTHEVERMLTLQGIQSIYNQPDYFVNNGTIIPNIAKAKFIDFSSQYMNWDRGNNTLVIEVTSNLDPGSAAAFDMVDILRDFVEVHFGRLVDNNVIEKTYVSGFSAIFDDSRNELYADVPLMLTVAVVLIFIALMTLFRSVLLPAKAIITISGSILFGLGGLVFVFQQGNLLNIAIDGITFWEAEQSGIVYFIPVFLFTVILGLGMDYSIFIISRIREEYERGEKMTDAVGLGLSKTAGVVTSAATIMTVTFMVFAASPMLILKSMGLAMATAIVVDATVSRIVILPSAMRLAGKYNFWLPKWLDKILPKIKLDH